MKIAVVNTYDQRGGAARAAWRIFRGLRDAGMDAQMLVQEKRSDDPEVIRSSSPVSGALNPFRPYVDFALPLLQTRKRVLFSSSMIPDRVVEEIERLAPDVVHLNWITGGFIKIESLAKIGRPMVWTLHDMWGFTGGCHYTGTCERHLSGCGCCPLLHSERESDLSSRVFARKENTYRAIPGMVITTPSSWLADRVKESRLLGSHRVEVVPNGLDTSAFSPAERFAARDRLGLPAGKRIVLFGAIRGTENPLKGFELLAGALKQLNRPDILLAVFGSTGPGTTDVSGLDVRFFGPVADHRTLCDLYSAADLTAVPSVQEVFGQAATESMACGTPVAAFDGTGLKDIVVHGVTGYLAPPFEPQGLASGIEWILEDGPRHRQLCEAAREKAVKRFDTCVTTAQFLEIYNDLTDGTRR